MVADIESAGGHVVESRPLVRCGVITHLHRFWSQILPRWAVVVTGLGSCVVLDSHLPRLVDAKLQYARLTPIVRLQDCHNGTVGTTTAVKGAVVADFKYWLDFTLLPGVAQTVLAYNISEQDPKYRD